MQLQNENTVVHPFLKYAPFIVIPTPAIKTQGHYHPNHTYEKYTHKVTPALHPLPRSTGVNEK
jgi:hypothetical protein